jgi:hypothetical protein
MKLFFLLISFIISISYSFAETNEYSNMSKEELVVEAKKYLKEFEKKFQELNIDEVIKRGSIEEFDNLKNDFHEYKQLLKD